MKLSDIMELAGSLKHAEQDFRDAVSRHAAERSDGSRHALNSARRNLEEVDALTRLVEI